MHSRVVSSHSRSSLDQHVLSDRLDDDSNRGGEGGTSRLHPFQVVESLERCTLPGRFRFYSLGASAIDPPLIHFLQIGVYCTHTPDFYTHRNVPAEGTHRRSHEVAWLHNAFPRDRFVFTVVGVRRGLPSLGPFGKLKKILYGVPPRWTTDARSYDVSGSAIDWGEHRGVEVVEILHRDVTALDYGPGLTSTRLAIETQLATTLWFESMEHVLRYYHLGETVHDDDDAVTPRSRFRSPDSICRSDALRRRESAESLTEATNEVDSSAVDTDMSSAATSGPPSARSAVGTRSDECLSPPIGAPPCDARPTLRRRVVQTACSRDESRRQVPRIFSADHLHSIKTRASLKRNLDHQIRRSSAPTPVDSALRGEIVENFTRRHKSSDRRSSSHQSLPSDVLGHKRTFKKSAGAPKSEFLLASSPFNFSDNLPIYHTRTMVVIYSQDPHFSAVLRALLVSGYENPEIAWTPPKSLIFAYEKIGQVATAAPASMSSSAASVDKQVAKTRVNHVDRHLTVESPDASTDITFALPSCGPETALAALGRSTSFAKSARYKLPHCLQCASQYYTASPDDQTRLLSLYESGIPTWAIFFPRYGLPYRRSFRVAVVTMLHIWPMVALVMGLYDLYKHIPHMAEWLGSSFVDWMETHLTLRVSLVIAYAFTSSLKALEGVVQTVKSFAAIFTVLLSPLRPLYFIVSTTIWFLWYVVSWLSLAITGPLRVVGTLVSTALFPAVSVISTTAAAPRSFTSILLSLANLWNTVLRPVKNLLKAYYDGIMHIGTMIARRELSIRQSYVALFNRVYKKVVAQWSAVSLRWRKHEWRTFATIMSGVILILAVIFALFLRS